MSSLKDTTTATSTGVITLVGGASTFASLLAIGSTIPHVCVQDSLGNWEIGTYILTGVKTLTRQSIETSSNGGLPVVFPAGVKQVFTTVADSTVLPVPHLNAAAPATASGLVDSSGNALALGGGGGSAAPSLPRGSQYDRALIFAPPPRQANAIKGFSFNINDAMYVGAITDVDVYDGEAGVPSLSFGQAISKAAAFHWGKMKWDLGSGESLLVQMRAKTVAASTAVNLCGNYSGTDCGFSIGLYDPANASKPGVPYFNYKAQGAAAQSLDIPAALVGVSTVTTPAIPTDTWFNLTVHVDGATRMLIAYVNGQPHANAGVTQLNAGSGVATTARNFGLGHVPTDDSFTTTVARGCRFQAFRMTVLPAGLQFTDVPLLDWYFNNNPRILFTDRDYVGSI